MKPVISLCGPGCVCSIHGCAQPAVYECRIKYPDHDHWWWLCVKHDPNLRSTQPSDLPLFDLCTEDGDV